MVNLWHVNPPSSFPYGLDVAEVSVKYDFGDLLRWATILERFAVSNGNTIGVVGAGIARNIAFPPDHDVVWATTRISPVVDISINSSAVRHAVILYAYDAQEAANALPVLLPQLGIPTDGVGVIQGVREYSAGLVSLEPLQEPTTGDANTDERVEKSTTSMDEEPTDGESQASQPSFEQSAQYEDIANSEEGSSQIQTEGVSSAPIPAADDLTLASNGGISTYVIVGSAAAGLVVLASATLLAVRLRRREG